jgi:ectoine hydroxylase-related dioxygenase (phytanoyl-CoA dioxygenase family)
MTHPDAAKLCEVRRRGFTVVPGVLSAEEVPELRRLLQNCIDEDLRRWHGRPYPDAWMVQNLMARHVRFAQVMENTILQAYLCDLLGDTCIVYAYTSSSMPSGGSNYSHRIHVDCPRLIPGYITNVGVMLALDDFTLENGATYFLPGSFTRESPPSLDEFLRDAERVTPGAGDMVLFNARTFHMGGENRTPKPRHALTLNACRSYMRQRFDYPRLVPAEIAQQLTDVGRRFLGFNVRMPTSLEEYYVPEEQRLYKANQG